MDTLDLPIWRLTQAAEEASAGATAEARAAGVPVAGLVREKRQSLTVRERLKRAVKPGRLKRIGSGKLPGGRKKHGNA